MVSDRLDRRLLAYTLAAGAGLAAAPELADAAIVYTDPSNVTITTIGSSIDIDLDGNATNDLRVRLQGSSGPDYVYMDLNVTGAGQPTGVMGDPGFASDLPFGTPINALQTFQDVSSSSRIMAGAYYYYSYSEGTYADTYGPWADNNGESGFLGVSFEIAGADHFGWVRFGTLAFANESTGEVGINATLFDFAYESCPREGILAGQTAGGASCNGPTVPLPPSLGLLALGAAGLGLWRLGKN